MLSEADGRLELPTPSLRVIRRLSCRVLRRALKAEKVLHAVRIAEDF